MLEDLYGNEENQGSNNNELAILHTVDPSKFFYMVH